MDPYYPPAPPVYLRQPVRIGTPLRHTLYLTRVLLQLDYHLYTPAPSTSFGASTSDSHLVPSSSILRQLLQTHSETIRGIAPIGIHTLICFLF